MQEDTITEKLKLHYDKIAQKREKWIKRNRYYHRSLLRYYRMIIAKNSTVLELGCGTGNLIGNLNVSGGVGVDISNKMTELARSKHPDIKFITINAEEYTPEEKFDYIIVSGILGTINNIQILLQNLRSHSGTDTRIIIESYNPLWHPIIKFGEKIGLKMPEKVRNWLSIEDIQNFLHISGYEVISRKFLLFFPKNIPGLSFLINRTIGKLPFFRRLSLNYIVVARPMIRKENVEKLTSSVVITCRDEEGNIEGLVTRMPEMGANTEIIFVEGHSKDDTVAKIREIIKKYPEKDIKLLKQKGIGQGDAFRYGFDEAKGDLVIWLEADLTTPPEEAAQFWEAFITNRGEYINGSRFIYKMDKSAMPLLNFLGNRFFGILFTMLLKQRFTDTLCGFKAISKRNYMRIRQQIDYFGDFDPFGDFELIFGSIKNSLKVAEIPVHYQPRKYGESKAYGKSFFSFAKHGMLLLRMSSFAFIKFILS